MIVIDSSAIVAIWENEPDAEALSVRILEEPEGGRRLSVATYIEAGAVLAGRRIRELPAWPGTFGGWIELFGLTLVPVDRDQARVALEARIRYGRGFGAAAKLNFGDCFSYALAKTLKAPLLYIGNDFDRTDVRSALRRGRKT